MPATLDSKWPQVSRDVNTASLVGTEKAAEKMRANMIGELYKPKSGRRYRGHQASAPGESPASDSKALENSLKVEPVDKGHAVTSDSEHAKHLEFSTRKMAARPLFNPVAEQMRAEVPEIVASEIRKKVGA